jgi:hypothetical protein
MALAVAEGAESVPDIAVRLRRIPELEEARKALSTQDAYVRAQQAQANIPAVTHDDLRWADGIAWGTPTRYGNMSAQMNIGRKLLQSVGFHEPDDASIKAAIEANDAFIDRLTAIRDAAQTLAVERDE